MKRILVDMDIRDTLAREFDCSYKTLWAALHFRERQDITGIGVTNNRRARERYRSIRARAIELGGVEVELLKKTDDGSND